MSSPTSPLILLPNTYRAFYGAFPALREFQRDVIEPILSGRDLILQAATGSGKTEAILAPCMERVIRSQGAEAVLYIVPTRALVHDLRRRLEPLMRERLNLALGIRTGDVKRLPSGRADLLLATPESLDVMIGSANREVRAFLHRVHLVAVDEAHQLSWGYRGRHLNYLLRRLESRNHRRLQKIALSATLTGPEAIRDGLGMQPDADWISTAVQRQIQPHFVHLKREPDELIALIDDLALRFGARKLLLFANSRSRCDQLFSALRQQGYFSGATYLHYSNLKLQQRQAVERQFQRRSHALCIATSTLELGIDVGDVDSVILYEPPGSVTTFLQRLGRANRQSQTTEFWGICRGERAGSQLLQFLSLYGMAQQGNIERVWPASLPSVMVQQVVSMLYEHKRVSLSTLQSLDATALDMLMPALEAKHWLRRIESNRTEPQWRGGWRYARALKAHQIWSNFPETAEPFSLEVDARAVADLPPVVVRQLEVGDRVDLAGRCIRILDIQTGERKVVRARPAARSDEKEVFWVGSGPPVSWEVAQGVRALLQPEHEPDERLAQGLFSRPLSLLQQQRQAASRCVTLHNGIELSRTSEGLYRYATYLGTVGNLILEWTIRDYYEPQLDGFTCSSDALAVVCSDRIALQNLRLPVERPALRDWVRSRLRPVQGLFEFNAFARALPREMLIDEATDWLWDERLAKAFRVYRAQSSEIAAGDPAVLEWDVATKVVTDTEPSTAVIGPGPEPSILAREKARLGIAADAPPVLPLVPETHLAPRALTGTILGSYIQHQQCDRLLSFELLPYNQQPPKRTLAEQPLGAMRANRGREFEDQVMDWLSAQGVPLYRVPEQDERGQRLSLTERQALSLSYLSEFAPANTRADSPNNRTLLGILAQPVLIGSELTPSDPQVDGIGIPDLLEVRSVGAMLELTIVDIKDSAAPRYSQKWQVAFYAGLIQRWLRSSAVELPLRLASDGVLMTRPEAAGAIPVRHAFDLAPYLASFPLLLRRVQSILETPVAAASWRLQSHCSSCAYVDTCYRQSLSTHDIMLLPHLSLGAELKLRHADVQPLTQAAEWARTESEEEVASMNVQQATRLRAIIRAFTDNRVERLEATTSLLPANLSTTIVVIARLIRDPHGGTLRAWGLHRVTENTCPEETHYGLATTESELADCASALVSQLRQWQQQASGGGLHLVTFGAGDYALLREIWAESAAMEEFSHTDLRQVFARHFALPIPWRYTLMTVAQALGFAPPLTLPPYVFQDGGDEIAEALASSELSLEDQAYVQSNLQSHLQLQCQLWTFVVSHLRSDGWQETKVIPDGESTLEQACITFLEGQQRWREHDVRAVQVLALNERVARYRALGPLVFEKTSLDDEGRFLAYFRLPEAATPARFRPGDFLVLNPVGSPDLQGGNRVILTHYEPHAQRLAVIARRGRMAPSRRMRYALDEDLEDWTTPRILAAVREAFTPARRHTPLSDLLQGGPLPPSDARLAWAQRWLQGSTLNARQQQALLLPFHSPLGLIEGPPGTGKTHVLAWMMIALILEAADSGRPLRLAVSALTHQAIDNLLEKIQQLAQGVDRFPGRCLKWGRRPSRDAQDAVLTYVDNAEEVRQAPYLILGATGFGLYQLFDSQSGQFPAFFDWVIFDEASQVLLPQAILSLIYGKGRYIFCGDVRQLPPVVLGPQSSATDDETGPRQSILVHLLAAYDTPSTHMRVRLNETYRLNRDLCALPSRLWYEGDLQPAAKNADAHYTRPRVSQPDRVDEILDPDQPYTLVLADHILDYQQSMTEVEIITALASRLLLDYGLEADQLAIIAPHRAQNNAITKRLTQRLATQSQHEEPIALPVIDTVERLQGAERDVILVSLTTSDPDYLESPFLNNPNRFNVAITRARHKLVVIGSTAFFTQTPRAEAGLIAHHGFTTYYHACQKAHAVFDAGQTTTEPVPFRSSIDSPL